MDILEKTIEEKILEEISRRNKSIPWLSEQVFVGFRHLYYVLKGKPGEKRKLSDGLKKRIEAVLGKDFNESNT